MIHNKVHNVPSDLCDLAGETEELHTSGAAPTATTGLLHSQCRPARRDGAGLGERLCE